MPNSPIDDAVQKFLAEKMRNVMKNTQQAADAANQTFLGQAYSSSQNPDLFAQNPGFDPNYNIVIAPNGQAYQGYLRGNPSSLDAAVRISSNEVVQIEEAYRSRHDDEESTPSYLLEGDGTYYYVRKLGENRKYYLPIGSALAGQDYTRFQCMFSSNGAGVLVGTVAEDIDPSSPTQYHQFARYCIFPDFQLIPYKGGELADLSSLNYPIAPDHIDIDGNLTSFVVYCDPSTIISKVIDLNVLSDGKVSAPEQNGPGSRNMFYPYSTSDSRYFKFEPVVSYAFNGDTGTQYVGTVFGPGYAADQYVKYTTAGVQNFTWKASTSNSLFRSFQYVFNNDKDGYYNADLICTFVNAYIYGVIHSTWTSSFEYDFTSNYHFTPGEDTGQIFQHDEYSETRDATFSYEFPSTFGSQLFYFATPDLWLPNNTLETLLTESWMKTQSHSEAQTGPSYFNPHVLTDENGFNAITQTPTGSFSQASQFAYRAVYTVPAIQVPYNQQDIQTVTFYDGKGKVLLGQLPPFANAYVHEQTIGFDWADLNYDDLFAVGNSPTKYAVFAGRSTMVLNDLANKTSGPNLYGIITQILNNGNDTSTTYYGFRGRSFADMSNTAFVYKQNYSRLYFYSAPDLQQGNLSNINGAGDITNNPNLDGSTNLYGDAISQLVDFQSIADVYSNTPLANSIANIISRYTNQTVPKPTDPDFTAFQSALASIYTGLKALDPNLVASVNELKENLDTINSQVVAGNNFGVLGPDVIGYAAPDVFSDKIFSLAATFPFQQNNQFLKAIDSYIVQGYYTVTSTDSTGVAHTTEVIRNYNVDSTGLTTRGKRVSAVRPVNAGTVVDYILPLGLTDKKG